jgi:hypothetical protein
MPPMEHHIRLGLGGCVSALGDRRIDDEFQERIPSGT